VSRNILVANPAADAVLGGIRDIRSEADVRAFLHDCLIQIGPGFHPDTPGDLYISTAHGTPTFSRVGARRFDRNLRRCFEVLVACAHNAAGDVVDGELYALANDELAKIESHPAPDGAPLDVITFSAAPEFYVMMRPPADYATALEWVVVGGPWRVADPAIALKATLDGMSKPRQVEIIAVLSPEAARRMGS